MRFFRHLFHTLAAPVLLMPCATTRAAGSLGDMSDSVRGEIAKFGPTLKAGFALAGFFLVGLGLAALQPLPAARPSQGRRAHGHCHRRLSPRRGHHRPDDLGVPLGRRSRAQRHRPVVLWPFPLLSRLRRARTAGMIRTPVWRTRISAVSGSGA